MKTEMYLFAKFCYNYPSNFISECWKGWIADHLQAKFSGLYERHGSRAVMVAFYNELDSQNAEQLENWIKANYKG